ncbi:MAG: hypothetical protein ACYTJ0_18390 [Planctomycetota bacterium]|jgi:hypothetical protein
MEPWSIADIADALEAGLRAEAARLDAEQAVMGLDARQEVDLHPLLAAALGQAGYGVHREQRYPADRRKRRETEGERCDLVLTPDGRPLQRPAVQGTLFAEPDAVALDDAFWLEVKVVAQFHPEGPNAGYASQLLSAVQQDVTKLSKDDGILHAGILIVLFVNDLAVRDNDLRIWQDRCLERGLPISAPCQRDLPLTDRHGNAWCALAVYRVSHY